MLLVWAIFWFDPHRYLTVYLPDAVEKLPLVVMLIMLAGVAARLPPPDWNLPYLLMLAGMVVAIPLSLNTGLARDATKVPVLAYCLMLGMACWIRTPKYVPSLIMIMLLSFAYWAVLGGTSGQVLWHPFYSNQDGFGPLMVMGLGFGYYVALASRRPGVRYLAYGVCLLAVIGVITSFARGAVLSLGALCVLVWFRSPHKLRTLGAGVIAFLVVLVATRVFFPDGAFWAEIRSSFTEGASQGTGADRWALWQMAMSVFELHPVLGAGPGNFGVTAADLPLDLIRGDYTVNPKSLWGRNTHSVYFTLLSEQALVGVITVAWLLVDFWRRNRQLRSKTARAAFDAYTDGAFDLRYLALAIEAAMLAYLLTGFFYAQHGWHWMYTLLALNFGVSLAVRRALKVPYPLLHPA